jgi:RNA polymerase sigma factor (TIGR02999 family)
MSAPSDTSDLLRASRAGDRDAAGELFARLYQQLHELARYQLSRGRPSDTLNTTALVHEAYLKLMRGSNLDWADRKHFLAVAARAMRHLVVDHARRRKAEIHGGKLERAFLDADQLPGEVRITELLALDEALHRLQALSERLGEVVVLFYFGGLSVDETATVMDTSARTVKRDLRKARAYLQTILA